MLAENLAKLSRPIRNATSVLLIIVAAWAMYKWTITPQTAYLSAAKRYESAMDKVLEQNKSVTRQIESKKTQLRSLRENSAQLQSVIFTSEQAKEFFSDLQVISEQAGCAVNSRNLLPDRIDPENARLGIVTKSASLSVVGVYKDITKLLARLQTRTQKVWIDSIELQVLDSSSDKAKCDLTITICQIIDKDTL